MIQKKICLLGAFAVGKTSLVRQFVSSIYSDNYHTTVGVKVDKKLVKTRNGEVALIIWDTAGIEHDVGELRQSYLRGSSGMIYVADGTRLETLDIVPRIQQRINELMGELPFVYLINKADLINEWKINERFIQALTDKGWHVVITSAKTGVGVNEAFVSLAEMMAGG